MIFETHAHYEDCKYDEDRDELLMSMKDKNVGIIVDVCAEMESISKIREYKKKYDFVYGTVGVHPESSGELTDKDMEIIKNAAMEPKTVAIGEIGLDYHWDTPSPEIQKKWFVAQINMAKELNLPIVIHSRDACEDTMQIIEETGINRGVMHCFSYSKDIAQILVKKGFYIGVGGVVTFKNSRKLKEVVSEIPLENIILETDCPYMAPEPYRGTRNDSSLIKYVVREIANIRNISEEKVEEVTWNNAMKMYGLQ